MEFTKIQGAGNDFILLNNLVCGIPVEQLANVAKQLCERRVSIGANGLLVVDAPETDADFKMRFYNADGSLGEMCGNGARCIARYAHDNGIAGAHMKFETLAGPVEAWRESRRQYKIRLNDPTVMIPDYDVELDGVTYECSYVELGNPGLPHAVVRCDGLADRKEAELFELGARLRSHPAFPKGANVNFYEIKGPSYVLEKTFERGVEGFTLACGTGSGSVAAALRLKGQVKGERIRISVSGGELYVEMKLDGNQVRELYLIGDTKLVARGEILDEDLVL